MELRLLHGVPKEKDDYSAYCMFCNATVNVDNGGKAQLLQHSNTSKHKTVDAARKDSSQSRFVNTVGSENGIQLNIKETVESSQKHPFTVQEDKVCKAEILWILHAAMNNYSFSSCDSIKPLLTAMFSDSALPQCLHLGSSKFSYSISHGLGPYFLKQITDEFRKESPFFTVMFDETLNEQNVKQLDVYVRYWSLKESGIAERYIGSNLLGHATATDISGSIKSVLGACQLDLKYMIMLGSDGPNVNKAVFRLLDRDVKLVREFGLVSVGTCNLHIIHNAFGHGLKLEAFTNMIDFLENIHYWFSKFPSRQEDLEKAMESFGNEYSKTLKYVSNRWLSVVHVCERTLDLLPSLKVYFLDDLPKEKNRLTKNDRYGNICKRLQTPLTPVYLHFLISVGSLFEHFLKLLQDKSTLIHVLYDELSKLMLKLCRRVINEDVLKDKYGEDLLSINVRQASPNAKDIDFGNGVKKLIPSLTPEQKAEFLADAKEFYVVIITYLQENLPLKNILLKNLKILHLLMRKEPIKSSLPSVRRLANMLPSVIPENCVDKLTDEWRLYISDPEISDEWHCENKNDIDYFWNNVMKLRDNGDTPRYPLLTVLV